jgi:2-methylcitrate dehydratase PrpD
MQLAGDLAAVVAGDAERTRLSTCLLDVTAAVLAGSRTALGHALAQRYANDGARGYAFTLAYLAEISEYSHGHTRMAGHLGSTVLPAVLALAADAEVDTDRNAAAAAGYEAFARVGQALMPALEQWGSGSTGISGSFGAAVAAARAHGFDAGGISAALGVAAYLTPLTPLEGYLSGANSAEAAVATSTGLLAAELIELGADGSPSLLDDLHQRIVGCTPPEAFRGQEPARPAVHMVYFKPYPCCRFTHGPIQAALELANAGVRTSDIERLVVHTTPRAVRTCGHLPRPARLAYLERQFSIPYLVSLALLRGQITTDDVLGPPAAHDAEALTFAREHVSVEIDDDLVAYATICPTILRLRLRDGTNLEHRVLRPRGCLEEPMTDADIAAKFQSTAAPLLGDATTDAWSGLANELAWPEVGRQLRAYLLATAAPAWERD